jgi:hypothetical protein
MRSITVVGASLAGLSTVRALRAEGYDGEIVVVGEERHTPYDRPPLSKDFLKGDLTADALALGDADEYEVLDAQWLLGERAVRLDPVSRTVTLTGGRHVRTDGIVVAPGASPRTLPGTDGLAGVHTLRTLDDAQACAPSCWTACPGLSSSAPASSAPRWRPPPTGSGSTSPSSRRWTYRWNANRGARWGWCAPLSTTITGSARCAEPEWRDSSARAG